MSIRDHIAAANPIARVIVTSLLAGVVVFALVALVQVIWP